VGVVEILEEFQLTIKTKLPLLNWAVVQKEERIVGD
jgi:hypothetical protein